MYYKLPHHKVTVYKFIGFFLIGYSDWEIDQSYTPFHRAFKTVQSTTAFNESPSPLPSTCPSPCSHNLLPPQLTSSHNASGIENNQQEPGNCRTPKPLHSRSHQKSAGGLVSKPPWRSTSLIKRAKMTCCRCNCGCLSLLIVIMDIWLVASVTCGSIRLHLVVVTPSFLCLFLFLILLPSCPHFLILLNWLSSPKIQNPLLHQTAPAFSAPHAHQCAAPTLLLFPLPPHPLTPPLLTSPRLCSAGLDRWRVTTLSLVCPGSVCIRDWDINHTLAVLWLWVKVFVKLLSWSG